MWTFLRATVAVLCLVFVLPALAENPKCNANRKQACFTGKLKLKDQSPSRKIVDAKFGFVDSRGVGWQAAKGDVTDGASIPIAFQAWVGKPFAPKIISAAVLHDRYCDEANKRRVRKWKDTHRMFYEALLAQGYDKAKSQWMYYAVYTFGPRWEKLDKGRVCVGNLTPMCQQSRIGLEPSAKATPQPPVLQSPDELLKDYSFAPQKDGDVLVYRRSLLDTEMARKELQALQKKLESGGSIIPPQRSTRAEVDALNRLSDSAFPFEAIMLQQGL